MIGLLARLLAPRAIRPWSPTADLYFLNACGDWVGPGGPVRRLGPTVFASARRLLVIRHAAGAAPPRREGLVWLIDDAIGPALRDPGLPAAQRAKLRLYEARAEAAMLAAGAEVVVSSAPLAAAYEGRARTHLLDPYWGMAPAGLGHHDAPGPVRIAYLGSAVHAGDLARLVPVVARVLAARPGAEFHLAANHGPRVLGALAGHPRVRRFAQTRWPDYRAALARWRFHVALYPLAPGPVNAARSRSKLTEHAIVGAAALYSRGWAPAGEAAAAGAGLALPDAPAAWEAALLRLVDDAGARRALALGGRALALERDLPDQQRAFWRHLLDL